MNKLVNAIQGIVLLISFIFCVAIIFFAGPPSIADVKACLFDGRCTPEIENRTFYVFSILFASVTFPMLLLIWASLKKLSDLSAEIKGQHELISAMASHAVLVIDKSKFREFYDTALAEIRGLNTRSSVIATSSFTPPFGDIKDSYFSELAKIIINKSAHYRVLLAKGSVQAWDSLCREELQIRIKHLNEAATKSGGKTWQWNNNFSARRSRYHARIDFLVVGSSVFFNMGLSKDMAGDRGYIFIKDSNVAELFRLWFEVIWSDNELSSPINIGSDGAINFSE